jgi:hypothetical protein
LSVSVSRVIGIHGFPSHLRIDRAVVLAASQISSAP